MLSMNFLHLCISIIMLCNLSASVISEDTRAQCRACDGSRRAAAVHRQGQQDRASDHRAPHPAHRQPRSSPGGPGGGHPARSLIGQYSFCFSFSSIARFTRALAPPLPSNSLGQRATSSSIFCTAGEHQSRHVILTVQYSTVSTQPVCSASSRAETRQ